MASVISGANGFWLRSILNPPSAKADRAENRIRRYEGEPAYRFWTGKGFLHTVPRSSGAGEGDSISG